MNNFFIVTNREKDYSNEIANQIQEYLEKNGKKCLIGQEITDDEKENYHYTNVDIVQENIDCLIVLGGDGTMIQAARDFSKKSIPMLGINLGTMGYLAEADTNTITSALESLISDDYIIDKRMMLSGEIIRDGAVVDKDVALNDIVVSRYGSLNVINISIYVDGELIHEYTADGVIVSSPTGSTAYNLSAGGPIVMPDASLFVLTPICPHTLNSRSIILPDNVVVELELGHTQRNLNKNIQANFDGYSPFPLLVGDRIRICCSNQKTKLIRLSKISFLERISKKMIN